MKCYVLCVLAVVCSGIAGAVPADECAFFSQWTVAPHEDGSQHNWPSMAVLADGRVLVVWARLTAGDYTVVGAFSPDAGCSWSKAEVLIDHPGLVDADPSITVSGDRVFVTCTTVQSGGINTSETWCVRSEDSGKSWSAPYAIPMNHRYTCGKTHRGLRLKSGTLLMGYSWDVLLEQGGTLTEEGQMDLRAGVMRSMDNGETWTNGGDTHAAFEKVSGGAVSGTDEPAMVELEDGSVYMLMRTGSSHLYEARSDDDGETWNDVKPSPLLGSNAPAALSAFAAGEQRGILVVWDNAMERFPLCAAASFDSGRTWTSPKDIGFPYTGGQASYPSCAQAPDGALLAVWQQDVPGGRDIRLARFSLAWLLQEAAPLSTGATARIPDGVTPSIGYAGGVDPAAATPPWLVHQGGGTVSDSGGLAFVPMGGYYIDNTPGVWDGQKDKLVEATMRVIGRDAEAPENHSAAELWLGSSRLNSSCRLLFRENAVAFNSSYTPSVSLDTTQFHTYRILMDLKRRRASLFLDDQKEPVLDTSLGPVEGYDLDRVLFGDSGGAKSVSGTSEWKSVRWADVEPVCETASSSPSVTIVCFGDSTTAPRGPLQVFSGVLQADLRAQGINVNVVNAGVPGDTTQMARERFEQDVLARNPGVVTLFFGINDSTANVWKGVTESSVPVGTYEDNLRYFIGALRERGARPIVLTPNPLAWTPTLKGMYGKAPYNPDDPAGFNVLLKLYVDAAKRVAEMEGVPFIDIYGLFAGGSCGPLDRLLLDGMHPNDAGHRLIADQVLKITVPILEKAPSQ